jgi:hypothetical protein
VVAFTATFKVLAGVGVAFGVETVVDGGEGRAAGVLDICMKIRMPRITMIAIPIPRKIFTVACWSGCMTAGA